MTRPWSPQEVADRMQVVYDALDEAVLHMKEAGELAGNLKTDEERAEAIATIVIVTEARDNDEKLDAKLRDALITRAVIEDRRARRLAENQYETLKTSVRVLDAQAGILRSMYVSHRESRVDTSPR